MILTLIFNDSIILLYKKDTNLFICLAQQNDQFCYNLRYIFKLNQCTG